jgi:hypothetical protein
MAKMHKREARRYVRGAQASAVGLGVLAVAVWAVPIPGVNRPLRDRVAPAEPVSTAQAQAPVVRQQVIDQAAAKGMAERLEVATKHVAAAPTGPTGPTGAPPPPAAVASDWKYFGPIYEGSTARALVSVHGKDGAARQRVMKVGAEAEGSTLVAVTPAAITLRDEAGAEREVQRAGGDGTRVAWLKNVPMGARGAPGVNGVPGAPGNAGAPGKPGSAGAGGDSQTRSLDRLRRLRGNAGGAGAGSGSVAGAAGTTEAQGGLAPGTPEAALLGGSAGGAPGVSTEQYLEMQQKVDGAYPELGDMDRKYLGAVADGSMSWDEYVKRMSMEYENHGLKFEPPPGGPKSEIVRKKMQESGQAGGGR